MRPPTKPPLDLPRIIGHRGAAGLAPENTLASFALAAELGCRMVEFDVRLSADGVPVVFHDDTLDRCTAGHGPVRARTAGELAGLGVATLAEVLQLCRSRGLEVNIEIKPDRGDEARTAKAAMAAATASWPHALPAPLVSSFSPLALAAAAEAVPGWPRALLVERVPADWRRRVEALGCVGINAAHRWLSAGRVAEVKAAGYLLGAYTVNRRMRAEALWTRGVDAIFTDRPDILLHG
ncbi:MAG: glycerophosphodiester phosphodiesterase family protein [Solirubrobacterales bacterium]